MLEALGYKVEDLVPYIDWNYFFFAWGIPARFASAAGVLDCPACRVAWLGGFSSEERGQAAEAQKLMDEARCLLGAWRDRLCAAAFALLPAWSEGNDICVLPAEGSRGVSHNAIVGSNPVSGMTLMTLILASVVLVAVGLKAAVWLQIVSMSD